MRVHAFACAPGWEVCVTTFGGRSSAVNSQQPCEVDSVVGCAFLCETELHVRLCVFWNRRGNPGILQRLLTPSVAFMEFDGLDQANGKALFPSPSALLMLGVLCLLEPVGLSGFGEEIERS